MSDTPIAERLAAELGMPWPLRQSMRGSMFEDFVDQRHGPRGGGHGGARQDAAPPWTSGGRVRSTSSGDDCG